ncbi:hypothetical protein CR513_45807, partial [Mucuna pruriens]
MSNYCTTPCLHHGLQTFATLWQHPSSYWRHLGYIEKDFKMMPSVFLMPKSTRSSCFVIQHLEVATMVPLGWRGRYSIGGSIGPPFLEMPSNSSPPTRNVKKLEWPLVEGMKCPNNPYYSTKSLMFGVSTSWGHSQSLVDYVSRWVEAIATKTNDAKVVVDFLKSNIFCRFGVLKALISDQGKLHSRWDGPFVITNVFPYGAVELKDEHTNNTFQ